MVSVCLPSDALSQHLPLYLGLSYLGRGVSLYSCSSKARPLLLTLDKVTPPDLERKVAPLAIGCINLNPHNKVSGNGIMKVKVKVKLLSCVQLFATPCPSGSSIHGILQARVLQWVAISFSRGSSRPRAQTRISRIASRHFLPSEPPGKLPI